MFIRKSIIEYLEVFTHILLFIIDSSLLGTYLYNRNLLGVTKKNISERYKKTTVITFCFK